MKNAILFLLLLPVFHSAAQNITPGDTSWMLGPFVKNDDRNPVMEPDSLARFVCPVSKKMLQWEAKDVFNPAAVAIDNRVYLLYRAEDKIGKHAGTSRIGLASSLDGLVFRRSPIPVLYPDNDSLHVFEWEGGCEDPRVVKREDGLYVMTYTAYDGQTARLCVASSLNLLNWEKHGLAFSQPQYRDLWSKSGAIVCERVGNEIVARKIHDKYWMYWGDTDIFLATSNDLIHWKPAESRKKQLVSALQPRPGYFDSKLVEPGPFALLTPKGILLIYNSANNAETGDKSLPDMTYAAGQALFDLEKPDKLIARANRHFLHPDREYEITGQVNNVCFVEGLVWYKGRWLLYYGTADSKIAVAESEEQ